MQDVQDREVVTKLFDTIAPRFAARPGRLHAPAAHRLPEGRQRRNGAGRAGRQRVRSQGEGRRRSGGRQPSRRPRASAVGCARRPSGCAGRRTTPRQRRRCRPSRRKASRPQGHDAEKSRRQLGLTAVADVAWAFQILAATQFFLTGLDKVSDAPGMVQLFATVGLGQWFRYVDRDGRVVGAVLRARAAMRRRPARRCSALTMIGAADRARRRFFLSRPVKPIVLLGDDGLRC